MGAGTSEEKGAEQMENIRWQRLLGICFVVLLFLGMVLESDFVAKAQSGQDFSITYSIKNRYYSVSKELKKDAFTEDKSQQKMVATVELPISAGSGAVIKLTNAPASMGLPQSITLNNSNYSEVGGVTLDNSSADLDFKYEGVSYRVQFRRCRRPYAGINGISYKVNGVQGNVMPMMRDEDNVGFVFPTGSEPAEGASITDINVTYGGGQPASTVLSSKNLTIKGDGTDYVTFTMASVQNPEDIEVYALYFGVEKKEEPGESGEPEEPEVEEEFSINCKTSNKYYEYSRKLEKKDFKEDTLSGKNVALVELSMIVGQGAGINLSSNGNIKGIPAITFLNQPTQRYGMNFPESSSDIDFEWKGKPYQIQFRRWNRMGAGIQKFTYHVDGVQKQLDFTETAQGQLISVKDNVIKVNPNEKLKAGTLINRLTMEGNPGSFNRDTLTISDNEDNYLKYSILLSHDPLDYEVYILDFNGISQNITGTPDKIPPVNTEPEADKTPAEENDSKPQKNPEALEVSPVMSVAGREVTLIKGESYKIQTQVIPAASAGKVVYSSNNKKVASVDSQGVIKGIAYGNTVVNVKLDKQLVKLKVQVISQYTTLKAPSNKITVKKGKYKTILYPTVSREEGKNTVYISMNKKIATVDKLGRVKGIKKGKTEIKVKIPKRKEIKVPVVVN